MNPENLVIPPQALPFIRYQRSRYIERKVPDAAEVVRRYSAHVAEDYAGIAKHLPPASGVRAILEIGCGVGALNVFLQKHYPEARVELLDGDETTNAGGAGYAVKSDVYNSRAVTEELLAANGCKVDRWHDIGTKDRLEADVIVSLASAGYHYPFAMYDLHGLCIMDLRRGVPHGLKVIQRSIFTGPKYDRSLFKMPQ